MSNVVIVGAGAIGLFCAVQLARLGARVTVLEAEAEDFGEHGPAASLAAAGMLAPISEAQAESDKHPQLAELALASYDLWRAWSADAPWADGVRFDGAAFVARDEAHAHDVMARAEALGRRAVPISAGQWKKRTGLEGRVAHALFLEDEAIANPERVLSGLVMDARRYGVIFHFGADVKSASANEVKLWDGPSVQGDAVVLCPGAWANDELMAAAPALKLLRPAKGVLAPVQLDAQLLANIRAPDFYLARRGRDDVVIGSSMTFDTFSRAPEPDTAAGLLAAAEALVPGQVRAHGALRAWAGVRPMSPDWAPMIGRCDSGVFIAAGHSRNGWLLGPITAEIVCAQILGMEVAPLWAAFDPGRFQ